MTEPQVFTIFVGPYHDGLLWARKSGTALGDWGWAPTASEMHRHLAGRAIGSVRLVAAARLFSWEPEMGDLIRQYVGMGVIRED